MKERRIKAGFVWTAKWGWKRLPRRARTKLANEAALKKAAAEKIAAWTISTPDAPTLAPALEKSTTDHEAKLQRGKYGVLRDLGDADAPD